MNELKDAPRVVIAGMSGDAGKTIVTLALLLALRRRGLTVRAFKKGPDYIDTAWLAWAAGTTARNLDTYLMGFDTAATSFAQHAAAGFNLIEGNRGLFDGFDVAGTHSTAELAKCLDSPVVLVLNAAKMTRTAAALVLGCQRFDPALRIAGVVLNRVNGKRHENILRECIEQSCGLPVFGAVPKTELSELIPERHLGLLTPEEFDAGVALERTLGEIGETLELDRILQIARAAPIPFASPVRPELPDGTGLTIGVVRDSAFSFYYAENLEILERSGARLVFFSALQDRSVPAGLDALYIGGGFPEIHAAELSANVSLLNSLRDAAAEGLPIYSECGGLMLLSRAIAWRGSKYPMAGVFDFTVEVCDTAQGHGYSELCVDRANPFFAVGTLLRGHEFHYSRIVLQGKPPDTACAVARGSGCGERRDAALVHNTWAAYTHLHALASPSLASGIIAAANEHRGARSQKHA